MKRCKQAFAAEVDGRFRAVRLGTLVSDSDPVMKGREALFEDVEEHVRREQEKAKVTSLTTVERASADPGEKRALGRPRKAPEPEAAKPESGQAKPESVAKPEGK